MLLPLFARHFQRCESNGGVLATAATIAAVAFATTAIVVSIAATTFVAIALVIATAAPLSFLCHCWWHRRRRRRGRRYCIAIAVLCQYRHHRCHRCSAVAGSSARSFAP
jgi:hypothetical protein